MKSAKTIWNNRLMIKAFLLVIRFLVILKDKIFNDNFTDNIFVAKKLSTASNKEIRI